MLRKTSEAKSEAFFKCLEPAMRDFIQREIIERFQKKRKEPLFLAYGDFPGSARFKQLLSGYLVGMFEAYTVPNVGCCGTITAYLNNHIKANPEIFHNKIVWFDIKEMDPKVTSVDPDHFSALQSCNFYTWGNLETLKDDTIGIVVTYHCKTDALFGLNSYWDKFYDTYRLWKVYQSPIDYAAMIADDCRNLLENTGIKPVQKYYQKFQNKVLAFANMELKRRQKSSREHQWGVTYEKQNPYPYNQTVPGNSIDAFLKLVGDVNKKYGIPVESDSATKQQTMYQLAALAEAKANGDPDYIKYLQACNLNEEVHKALEDIGGEDYDGDGTMFVQI